MEKVKSQIEMLEHIDCFYPLSSCASALDPLPSGRPPRAKKDKKKTTKSSSSKNSKKKSQRESRDERTPTRSRDRSRSKSRGEIDRSRSKSRERLLLKEAAEKRAENKSMALKKRIGAAYVRSADSIATRETTKMSADHHELVEVQRSEDTYTTGSVSISSSGDTSGSSDINSSIIHSTSEEEGMSQSITTRLRNINNNVDASSITTEDVETKPTNAFSWFQAQLKSPMNDVPEDEPQSDGSVGAVKRTIRGKFDYIRKNQRFTNPFPDPPSDQSMATSRSIRAEDAGSLLKRGRRSKSSKLTTSSEALARRNELVKTILKQRTTGMVSRPGFDP